MIILGISAFFHDSAAALLIDGVVVAAAQEERFSRIKHDAALPVKAVQFCLDHAGLTIEDVDHVVFYEKPLKKFERILVTHLREFPRGVRQFSRALSTWLGQRLWLKSDVCKQLGCHPKQLLFCEHHLSHAASAYFSSPFEDAAVVTVDGVGEWATTSIYKASTSHDGSKIELLRELHFPHSIGLLYSAITAYLGFEVNEGEYKVMGLSAYGKPLHLDAFEKFCSISDDGSLSIDSKYFCYHRHPTKSFTRELEVILGPARTPGAALHLPARTDDDARFANIAATLQAVTEQYMLKLARQAHALTGSENLCLAGGVALNCVANRRIQVEGPYKNVFVQPAAGDAGGSLGCAQWVEHVLYKGERTLPLSHAFLGAAYSQNDVVQFLNDCKIEFQIFDSRTNLHDDIARRLAEQQVGGYFQGRFEWGPRALGARSIIADARDPKAQERVNQKIKFRESFRPFAPAVLAEDVAHWFHVPRIEEDLLSPFMCSVAKVLEGKRGELPAVTHVDGTARLQRIDRENNPVFYDLVNAFKRHTGVGVILNTSMNLKDEPLCASPAEALGVFNRSDLDFLVLERCLIEKRPS